MAKLGIGKKGEEWLKAKPKLIERYKAEGITSCENCNGKFALAFHHRPSRASQKAIHDFEHTRLLDQKCHDFFEVNDEADKRLFAKPRGFDPKNKIDIMADKKKKSKKPDWQQRHKCVKCKEPVEMLICPKCGHMSIK